MLHQYFCEFFRRICVIPTQTLRVAGVCILPIHTFGAILKQNWEKWFKVSKNFRAARALFLMKFIRKIGYTLKNFPRCAQLFLKNSLATMDGIIWICKVSKSSTLARLIITYPYLFTKCQHFYVTKNFRWIYFGA